MQTPPPPLIPYLYIAPCFAAIVGIHGWARGVEEEGRVFSRFKVFLAIFIICLATAAWVAVVVYNFHIVQLPFLGMVAQCLGLLALMSWLDFFPIYTLLKRRLIPYKIVVLTGLPLIAVCAVCTLLL